MFSFVKSLILQLPVESREILEEINLEGIRKTINFANSFLNYLKRHESKAPFIAAFEVVPGGRLNIKTYPANSNNIYKLI